MTAASSLSQIFTGTPKLIAAGLGPTELADLAGDGLCGGFLARLDATGALRLAGSDGETGLTAPPAGPVVIGVGADGDAAATAEALAGFWARAGLEVPETVALDTAPAEGRARVAAALARRALALHAAVAGEAVALDRQLAALREQLEDARNKWQECSTALKALTRELPVLAFSTQEFTGARAPGPEAVLSQLLPFASLHCKAAAVHIARPATADGRLECRLMAQEDDVTLAQWGDVDAGTEGWRIFDMPADIPWRYRGLRLVFTWTGPAEGAPALSLAPAAGMDRYFLHQNAAPQPNLRLAMRAWIGHPTAPATGFEARHGTSRGRDGAPQAVGLGRDVLAAHRKLVERSLGEWPWVVVEDTGILVHPTLKGPSVVALDVALAFPVTGISLTLESPNAGAPEIEFLVAVFPGDLDLTLDDRAADPLPHDKALAGTGWQAVMPGSAMPVALALPEPQTGPLQLVLATRVTGATINYAHGWFRDLRAETQG